jgi:hypothetical protein
MLDEARAAPAGPRLLAGPEIACTSKEPAVGSIKIEPRRREAVRQFLGKADEGVRAWNLERRGRLVCEGGVPSGRRSEQTKQAVSVGGASARADRCEIELLAPFSPHTEGQEESVRDEPLRGARLQQAREACFQRIEGGYIMVFLEIAERPEEIEHEHCA